MLPNYHYNIRNQSLVPRKLGTTPVVLVLNAVVLCITSCSRFHVYNAKFILITPPCIEGKGKNHHQLKKIGLVIQKSNQPACQWVEISLFSGNLPPNGVRW